MQESYIKLPHDAYPIAQKVRLNQSIGIYQISAAGGMNDNFVKIRIRTGIVIRAGYLFFDLDGTLLDTIHDIQRAINQALKDCGYSYSFTFCA